MAHTSEKYTNVEMECTPAFVENLKILSIAKLAPYLSEPALSIIEEVEDFDDVDQLRNAIADAVFSTVVHDVVLANIARSENESQGITGSDSEGTDIN